MHIELLTVGTELLLGFTVDTNGAHIARALGEIGVRVVRRGSVGDQEQDIADAVREALARTGAVIIEEAVPNIDTEIDLEWAEFLLRRNRGTR